MADIAANADPPLPPRAWLEMNRAAILDSIDAELAHRDKPWFGLNP